MKRYSKNIFKVDDITPSDDPMEVEYQRELADNTHYTYDYRRYYHIKRYLDKQQGIDTPSIYDRKDGEFSHHHGDSYQFNIPPTEEEIAFFGKDARLPSVFARSPLQISSLLPKMHIPICFLYGDDDWLYQADVPFIVDENRRSKDKLRQTIFSTSKNSPPTSASPIIELPRLAATQEELINSNNIEVDNDVIILDTETAINKNRKALAMLNFSPAVTIGIIPNAGHHLYSNNPRDFNMHVRRTVMAFSQQFQDNLKPYGGKYDPAPKKRLFKHYYNRFQQSKSNGQ